MSMYEVVACNDCGEQTTRGNQPCRLCRSFEGLCSPSPKPAEPVRSQPVRTNPHSFSARRNHPRACTCSQCLVEFEAEHGPSVPTEPNPLAGRVKPYRERMAQIYDTTDRAMGALKAAADAEIYELRAAYTELLKTVAGRQTHSANEVPVPRGLEAMFGEDLARETVRTFAEKRQQHGYAEGIEAAARVLGRMGSPVFAAAVRELLSAPVQDSTREGPGAS